jgi:hypothetical protein
VPAHDNEPVDQIASEPPAPPGEFVSSELADATARFLEDLRRRTGREGNGARGEN